MYYIVSSIYYIQYIIYILASVCFRFDRGVAFPSSTVPLLFPLCQGQGWSCRLPWGPQREKIPGFGRRLGSGSGSLRGLGEISCREECLAPPAPGAEAVQMICKVPGGSDVAEPILCQVRHWAALLSALLIQRSQQPHQEAITVSFFIEIQFTYHKTHHLKSTSQWFRIFARLCNLATIQF